MSSGCSSLGGTYTTALQPVTHSGGRILLFTWLACTIAIIDFFILPLCRIVAACGGVLLRGPEDHSKPVICKFTAADEDVVHEFEVL